MLSAIRAERLKARRRHDLLLATGIALSVLLWASNMEMRTEDALASGYDAMLYAIPVMHTTVMPLGMAALCFLMPWSYYLPLSNMAMNWDRATRICTFVPLAPGALPLLLSAVLAALFAALACRAIGRREG